MRSSCVVVSIGLTALGGCASSPPDSQHVWVSAGKACEIAQDTQEEIVSTHYRQDLPRSHPISRGEDWYPPEGKLRNLQGSVLATFRIDSTGRVASPRFLRIDAPPVIQLGACKFLYNTQFEPPKPELQESNDRSFLTSMLFCLDNCSRVHGYPNTKAIVVTGSSIPRRN